MCILTYDDVTLPGGYGHPVNLKKSNRALGFPALVTGLCQSYRVLVPPARSCHRDIGKYTDGSTDF